MKFTGRTKVSLLGVLVLGLLAGSAYVFLGPAQGQPVLNEQSIAQTQVFREVGGHFGPPPVNTVAKLTPADAFKAYLDDAVPPGLDKATKEPPVVSLAVFTSDLGETSGIAPTLVWLIKFVDTPVIEFGPDINGTKSPDSGFRCPFYVVIDATSGQRLESFQTCGSPTTS